mmetsp:Transcript_19345/g.26668  ORF Transcript_19345/g.26668 Transcript_19345/m.26668 type:complete len:101 (-) Transcript_19345:141-443(-)
MQMCGTKVVFSLKMYFTRSQSRKYVSESRIQKGEYTPSYTRIVKVFVQNNTKPWIFIRSIPHADFVKSRKRNKGISHFLFENLFDAKASVLRQHTKPHER